MLSSQLLCILASLGGALAATAAPALKVRDGSSAVVNFNNNTGTPNHLASGILYGVPDQQGQIPDQFYTDMGFNYLRAGGAQLGAPARGWIWGVTEYEVGPVNEVVTDRPEPFRIGPVELQDGEGARRSVHLPHSRSIRLRLDAELVHSVSGRQRRLDVL